MKNDPIVRVDVAAWPKALGKGLANVLDVRATRLRGSGDWKGFAEGSGRCDMATGGHYIYTRKCPD